MNPIPKLEYRSDIDGLRGLAVALVVLFHAFPSICPAGFIGVDIFFVISGFLISRIVIFDLEKKRFSFLQFYNRRVRRIFPALILLLVFVFAFGWIALLKDEFKQLCEHIFGNSLFISNFTLWSETGYFDKALENKPLAHLWSLAVEEQFYLFFPTTAVLAYKFKFKLHQVVLAMIVASLIANSILMHTDPAADFYFPFARAWELLLGAWLACAPIGLSKRMRIGLGWLALLLLVLGLSLIRSTQVYPGWWALLPAFSAASWIASDFAIDVSGNISGKALANPVFIFLGKISYPLYLWHWSVLSFARIVTGEELTFKMKCISVTISLCAAIATERWIERTCRFRLKSFYLSPALALALLILGGFGALGYWTNRFDDREVLRLNPVFGTSSLGNGRQFAEIGCGLSPAAQEKVSFCLHDKRGEASYALIGDSKADALYPGLLRNSSPQRWIFAGGTGKADSFLPIISDDPVYKEFSDKTQIVLESLLQNKKIKVILLSVALRQLFQLPKASDHDLSYLKDCKNYEAALQGLSKVVDLILKSGRRLVITIDNPTFPEPRDCMERVTNSTLLNLLLGKKSNPHCHLLYQDLLKDQEPYRKLLAELQLRYPKLVLFDQNTALCDVNKNRCEPMKEGRFLYAYSDHMSDNGNELVSQKLIPIVDELASGVTLGLQGK